MNKMIYNWGKIQNLSIKIIIFQKSKIQKHLKNKNVQLCEYKLKELKFRPCYLQAFAVHYNFMKFSMAVFTSHLYKFKKHLFGYNYIKINICYAV